MIDRRMLMHRFVRNYFSALGSAAGWATAVIVAFALLHMWKATP